MFFLKNNKINKEVFYILVLIIFSFSFNQYYGYKGILPIDSFLIFNSGYDFLNGYYPFKDYWTIKEPFIDFLQAQFFKLFGVTWFAYVLHASFFNFLITISTYLILRFFLLSPGYSFFYSLCVAILTYPSAGTPFSDHHALILSVISLYIFFLAIKTNKNIYWFIIPFFLGFSFLCKQAPTAYIVLVISFFSLIYFIFKKNFKGLFFSILGLTLFIVIFFLILHLVNIQFIDFFTQYILFPQSLGSTRLDWVFPLEFQRIVMRFKIHYLSITIMTIILFNSIFLNNKKIKLESIIIILSLISTCFLFIFHQLMTINAIFIYCLIPIFSAFSHVFSIMYYEKKYFKNFLLILTLFSSIHYFVNYVHNRTFMDLKDVEMSNSLDGSKIDKRLKNIDWITVFYPKNPQEEINIINLAIEFLKKDPNKKMIITDYQFISVFLDEYDYSVTRFWYDFHGYPSKENKFFNYWKNFVVKNVKKNNIKNIYVLKPLHGENKPLENIFDHCLVKENISKNFYKINLSNCFN